MTKGSTERDADEPTREDKDAGPSARASTGKRASIASTKVRFYDDYECGSSFFFPRVDGRTRTYEPSVQSARLVVLLGGAFASLRAASDIVVIDVIDRWMDGSIDRHSSIEGDFFFSFEIFSFSVAPRLMRGKIKCKFKSNVVDMDGDLSVRKP